MARLNRTAKGEQNVTDCKLKLRERFNANVLLFPMWRRGTKVSIILKLPMHRVVLDKFDYVNTQEK